MIAQLGNAGLNDQHKHVFSVVIEFHIALLEFAVKPPLNWTKSVTAPPTPYYRRKAVAK
jgi:hypothetical protein